MNQKTLLSIIDTPTHPDYSALYRELGFTEIRLDSMRKACSLVKNQPADVIVAEFVYGYGNNYAGINISNLDVFLHARQRYAPEAKVIVLVDKTERQYADKLAELFPLHAILVLPVSEAELSAALQNAVHD